MTVRVSDVMTRNVVAVQESTPIDVARTTLLSRGFFALPVRDDRGRLVGIVTEADLLPPDPRDGRTVGDVMTTDVISVPRHLAASVASHRMVTYGFRALPVVEGYDTDLLVGIVTRRDLLGELQWAHRKRPTYHLWKWLRRPAPVPPLSGPSRRTTAQDVMTWVASAREDWSVERAAKELTGHGFTALPVVDDDDRVIGIVTESHLLPDPLTGRRAHTVGGVMERDVITARADEPVSGVVRSMEEHELRAIPVVDGTRRLVGIVTRRDLLR